MRAILLLLYMLCAIVCTKADYRQRSLGHSKYSKSKSNAKSSKSTGGNGGTTKSPKSSKESEGTDYVNPATTICGDTVMCAADEDNEPVCTDPPSGAVFITTGEGCVEKGECGDIPVDYNTTSCDNDNCTVIADGFFFIAFPGVAEEFELNCTTETDLEAQILGYLGDQLNDGDDVEVLSVAIVDQTVASSTQGTITTSNLSVKIFVTIKLDICYADEISDVTPSEISLAQLAACGCARRLLRKSEPSWDRELFGSCTYSEEMICAACNSIDCCYCSCYGGFRRHLASTHEKHDGLLFHEGTKLRGLQATAECCGSDNFICRVQNGLDGFENVTEVNSVINVTDTDVLADCVNTEILVESGETFSLACSLFNSTCPQEGELPQSEVCCANTDPVQCDCFLCNGEGSFFCCEGGCPTNPSCGGN